MTGLWSRIKLILSILEAYIDYILPREILGVMIVVFAGENVIDILFSRYIPDDFVLEGWVVVFILSIVIVAYWGEIDDDREEYEKEVEKVKSNSGLED